jgi:hypothetical protein
MQLYIGTSGQMWNSQWLNVMQLYIGTSGQMWNSQWLNAMQFLQTLAVSVPNNADSLQVTGVSSYTGVAGYCDD